MLPVEGDGSYPVSPKNSTVGLNRGFDQDGGSLNNSELLKSSIKASGKYGQVRWPGDAPGLPPLSGKYNTASNTDDVGHAKEPKDIHGSIYTHNNSSTDPDSHSNNGNSVYSGNPDVVLSGVRAAEGSSKHHNLSPILSERQGGLAAQSQSQREEAKAMGFTEDLDELDLMS